MLSTGTSDFADNKLPLALFDGPLVHFTRDLHEIDEEFIERSSEESRAGGGDPGKLGVKKSRLKASSPNRQGPQQCQMSEIDCHSNFIQIGSSATVVVRLLIYAYQEYLCNYQSENPAAATSSIALYSPRLSSVHSTDLGVPRSDGSGDDGGGI
ncbi:hypothetical protein ALC53_06410 [Atta colombica]|uniref:Uncharacterized protein n=1 Tax=Atta colombica TaxID=520822 RepID=A0A195BEZ0_9HYME|nr:hypothetical protein ALC53_06410 [Atta colombica]